MRLHLALVSETTDEFINQVRLCLFSLRKNGGALKDIPVTLITNSEGLSTDQEKELKENYSPLEFVIGPRLGAIPHTSKLNVFYSIDPSTYDVLIFMDCDIVVRKPLDHMLDPIINDGAQFVCRRGGTTDRNRFVNFDALVSRFCGKGIKNKVLFEGKKEWPMFNSGVFLVTSEAAVSIRKDCVEFTYQLFNEWQRRDARENLAPFIKLPVKYLYRFRFLRRLYRLKILTRQDVIDSWPLEQGAIALACIKAGVRVQYLDDTYNSWGGVENFRILHCFKSLYKFDRRTMLTAASEEWTEEYVNSDIPGKCFLGKIVREYRRIKPGVE